MSETLDLSQRVVLPPGMFFRVKPRGALTSRVMQLRQHRQPWCGFDRGSRMLDEIHFFPDEWKRRDETVEDALVKVAYYLLTRYGETLQARRLEAGVDAWVGDHPPGVQR